MKCTRCGKEMTIRPIETGTDEAGNPVFTRYALCYNCKIKVNLDKKKENDRDEEKPVERVEETQIKVKRKKKKGKQLPSVSLPKRKGGKEKRGGGLLKFLIFVVFIAAIGFAAYTYRRPIMKFAQQMYEKYVDKDEEEQVNEPKGDDSGNNSDDSDITAKPDIEEPQSEGEPTDSAVEEGQDNVPKTENGAAQDSQEVPSDGTVTEPQ